MNRLMILVLLLAVSFLQTLSAHADPKYLNYRKMLRAQTLQAASFAIKLPKKTANSTFDQMLDHFSKKVPAKTFKQRYFIDNTYARDSNSPVIYYLCGEGTCSGPDDSDEVNTLAQKYRANRVALEHRYYGYSQPFKTMTADNLKYLSMDQALEDLATFQVYAQKNLGLKGKWIVVGGSYPGELSAFYRMKHPELVVGALASSAPVLAKADFFEYDQHVAKVAGPACLQAIQSVVKDVEAKLKQSDSATAIKALFKSSQISNDVDFLYVIADMGAAAIQYGFQDQFCNALAQGVAQGKATEAYAKVGVDVLSRLGVNPYQDSFAYSASVNPADYIQVPGGRPWMYQSCTEFGFYQIANSNASESARSQQISQAYHNDVCKRLFGITVPVNTAATNSAYYQKLFDAKVTNIFFTNGSNDPWSKLSITQLSQIATNPGLHLFVLEGASHCSDLGSRVSDAVTSAQNQFDVLMKSWLSE